MAWSDEPRRIAVLPLDAELALEDVQTIRVPSKGVVVGGYLLCLTLSIGEMVAISGDSGWYCGIVVAAEDEGMRVVPSDVQLQQGAWVTLFLSMSIRSPISESARVYRLPKHKTEQGSTIDPTS